MRTMVVLGLLLALPASAAVFEDVPTHEHWAADAVSRVVDAGIMQGRADGLFHGDETVTRYELAVILDRLLKAQGQPGLRVFGGLLRELKSTAAPAIDAAVGVKSGPLVELLGDVLRQMQEQAKESAGPAREQAQALLKQLAEAAQAFRAEELKAARERLGQLADRLQSESDALLKDLAGPRREEAKKLFDGLREELAKTREELRGKRAQRVEELLDELLAQGRQLREEGLPQAGEKLDRLVNRLLTEGRQMWESPEAVKARGKMLETLTQMMVSAMMNQMKAPQPAPPTN